MTRHPATEGGAVEQVAALLDDGLDVDDIAATLAMSEAEVGRIARALAERVPAPRNPLEDRTPEPQADPKLEEDEAPRPPSRDQVKVAALVVEHSTSGTDLDDLAGALGVRHAVEPAERWLAALAATPEPAHVHDPGPAWDEDGTAYAWCASCSTRWDRASCDICGLPVTALVIAESGLRRHRHHRTEATA